MKATVQDFPRGLGFRGLVRFYGLDTKTVDISRGIRIRTTTRAMITAAG